MEMVWRLCVFALNRMPRPFALWLGARLGAALYWIAERTRFKGAVRRTIRTAFPDRFSDDEVEAMAKRHARDLMTTVVEVARFRELPELMRRGVVAVEGRERLEEALRAGKGAVLLSAHMGNWELLICTLGLLGLSAHAVVLRQAVPWFNRWIVRERERFGTRIHFAGETTSRTVADILARGGVLLLLADHHHYGGDGRNIVEFFGKPVSVPGGPVAYSSRFGAPLVPVYTVRTPAGGHRIVFEPPLELDPIAGESDFQRNCRRYMEVYERWIRAHPGEWMWSHERWAWLDVPGGQTDLKPPEGVMTGGFRSTQF